MIKPLALRQKSPHELEELLESLQREVMDISIKLELGEDSKPHRRKEVRKDIARIKTILHETKLNITKNPQ